MKELVDVSVILDRSGSMSSCREDVMGGFNTFIAEQKKSGKDVNISLYQFDDLYEKVYENIAINEIKDLTEETYIPRGMTALYDAIGKTIVSKGEHFASLSEDKKPSLVICVIITDGLENQSIEYRHKAIKEMITHQQDKYKWQFIFIGSEIESIDDAQGFGIKAGNTMRYKKNKEGNKAVFASLSRGISSYSAVTTAACGDLTELDSVDFFDDVDRKAQDDA